MGADLAAEPVDGGRQIEDTAARSAAGGADYAPARAYARSPPDAASARCGSPQSSLNAGHQTGRVARAFQKSQSRASAPAIRQQRLHVDGRFIPHLLQCGAQDRSRHQQQTSMSPSGRNLARALNLAKASTACSGAGMPSSDSFTIEDLPYKQGRPRGHDAAYHSDGRHDVMRSDRDNTTPQRSHVIQTAGSTTWLADAVGYRGASRQQDLGTGCTEMAKTAICWSCLA